MAFNYVDISGKANYNGGQVGQVNGIVIHHTAGGGSASGVVDTLNQRGLGVQYVMERDGTVYQTLPDGARGAHMLPGSNFPGSADPSLNNSNTVGIEIIAKNNNDLTPAQRESAKAFIADQKEKNPNIGDSVYGHGELNPGHKQADEGMAVTNDYRNSKGIKKEDINTAKTPQTPEQKAAAEQKAKENAAQAAKVPPKKDQNDIQGTTGEYKKTQTQTISSVMPTHEPWPGHPKSQLQPRQAVEGGGAGSNGSSGSSDGTSTGTNGNGNTSNTATGAPLAGKTADRINQAYNRLVNEHGFTPDAAKAAVATTMGEALTVDYTKVRWDVNGPSAGIAQWHDVGTNGGGRYSKYKAFMDSAPGGAANLDNQIDYLAKDLKENYKGVFNTMQNSSAAGGVDAMVKKFEIPRNAAGESIKRQGNLGRINATLQKIDKTGDNGVNPNAQNQKPSNQSTTGQQDAPSQSQGSSTTPNSSTTDSSGKGSTTDDSSTTQTSTNSTSTTPSTASSGTSGGLSNVAGAGGALQAKFTINTPGTGVSTGNK